VPSNAGGRRSLRRSAYPRTRSRAPRRPVRVSAGRLYTSDPTTRFSFEPHRYSFLGWRLRSRTLGATAVFVDELDAGPSPDSGFATAGSLRHRTTFMSSTFLARRASRIGRPSAVSSVQSHVFNGQVRYDWKHTGGLQHQGDRPLNAIAYHTRYQGLQAWCRFCLRPSNRLSQVPSMRAAAAGLSLRKRPSQRSPV
jgi:hypothetical protein